MLVIRFDAQLLVRQPPRTSVAGALLILILQVEHRKKVMNFRTAYTFPAFSVPFCFTSGCGSHLACLLTVASVSQLFYFVKRNLLTASPLESVLIEAGHCWT